MNDSLPSWLALAYALGTGLVTAVVALATTRTVVSSLREQVHDLTETVKSLSTTIQNLTVSTATKAEELKYHNQKIEDLRDEMDQARKNLHDLRNWLLDFAHDVGLSGSDTIRKLPGLLPRKREYDDVP